MDGLWYYDRKFEIELQDVANGVFSIPQPAPETLPQDATAALRNVGHDVAQCCALAWQGLADITKSSTPVGGGLRSQFVIQVMGHWIGFSLITAGMPHGFNCLLNAQVLGPLLGGQCSFGIANHALTFFLRGRARLGLAPGNALTYGVKGPDFLSQGPSSKSVVTGRFGSKDLGVAFVSLPDFSMCKFGLELRCYFFSPQGWPLRLGFRPYITARVTDQMLFAQAQDKLWRSRGHYSAAATTLREWTTGTLLTEKHYRAAYQRQLQDIRRSAQSAEPPGC